MLILLNCLISEAGSVSAKLKSALDLPAWDFGVCPSMTNNADQFPSRVSGSCLLVNGLDFSAC